MTEKVYGGPEGNPLSPHNREREEAKHRAEMVWKAAKHDEAVAQAESLQRQVSEYREAVKEHERRKRRADMSYDARMPGYTIDEALWRRVLSSTPEQGT